MVKTRSRFKIVPREAASVENAASDGFSIAEELHGEMEEWAGNMENANMEHLPKYEEVSEARDALEEAKEEVEFPTGELPAGFPEKVTWSEAHTKRRSQSRATRASFASSALEAAASTVEAFLEEHDEDDACWAVEGVVERSDLEQYAEDLKERAEQLNDINFPGMF